MAVIRVEDLFYPGVVSLLAAAQLARFARRVGEARGKYKIPVPKTEGDPNFTRVYRAQQNTLEFHPIFMTLLWTSSIFLHSAIPSFIGLIYIYSRQKYFNGYCASPSERLPGFRLAIKAVTILLFLSIVGIGSTGYTKYTGNEVDLSAFRDRVLEISEPLNSTYHSMREKISPYLNKTRDLSQDFVKISSARISVVIQEVCRFVHDIATYMKGIFFGASNEINKETKSSKHEL